MKKQARDLHKALRARAPDALARLRAEHPRFKNDSEGEAALSDAQLVVAREYGYPSWPRLKTAVEDLAGHAVDEVDRFMSAVRAGRHDEARGLLERDRTLVQTYDRHSFDANPVTLAVARQDLKMVDLLLEAGGDINRRSRWWAGGFSPLHAVFWSSNTKELARELVARGAVVDAHSAAGLGDLRRLAELLDANPRLVHERGGDGQFPLHYAATPEVAAFLLARGAEIDARDLDHGGAAAQFALKDRHAVARFLIDRGAKADLFMACVLGDLRLVRELYEADPSRLDARVNEGEFVAEGSDGGHIYCYVLAGSQPLHAAAAANRVEVVEWLLDRGANPNAGAERERETPLHACAWHGSVAGARALLARGADPELQPKHAYDNTPMGWAIVGGMLEMVELFIEHGVKLRDGYLILAREGVEGKHQWKKGTPIETRKRVLERIEAYAARGGAGA
ncbi:MAG: ankyrin repeat domain-containing protein [Planctomycetota bacterium]|nr:ankyrin repeat domain-containing protein [Planctomycetota bacterium]